MLKRVLICANPDLNYIDGSSIWAQTIALATAATATAQVDFIAKSTPERDELFAPLKTAQHLNIIDGTKHQHWQGKSYKRLSLAMMAELAVALNHIYAYDVIIVRGLEIATELLKFPEVLSKCWMYLTDIPQNLADYDTEQQQVMQSIGQGCQKLLCQTEGFKTLWQALVPSLKDNKFNLYTPVIPDIPDDLSLIAERPVRAIYAGKFKADWMTLEMVNVWPSIHSGLPESEFVMIGDKIHNEPFHPEYQQHMQQALEDTDGLLWFGAQSREVVQQKLQQARVGLSWRAESMNDTVEYSTKILEYGGAGCAAILNRNALHEQLLGSDYPLFANSAREFSQQLTRALMVPEVAQQAADALQKLAKRHTFSTRVNEIRQWLADIPAVPKAVKKTRILVAGHDLKFFTLLQSKLAASGQFEFLIDQWQGHDKHNESQSHALLQQADIVFCEWCLGNLKWYSHHKLPHQRLIARFHLQERELPYVAEANWDNIDHISYVSEFIRREGQKTFGFPYEKTSVIANLLDDKKFTPKKKTDDSRYTLGIIGVAPSRKRLDRAIDLLEALLEEDDRYCLRVKGRNPLNYNWLLKREDELAYYQQVFERININPKLRYKVIFDPPGDDVNEWFTMVGFILSPSDFESFHMAIGEGMLTGSVPIIWDWDGAAEIWGEDNIISSLEGAKNLIINSNLNKELDNTRHVLERLSSKKTVGLWEDLLKSNTCTDL
ncbi:glycosyltransferase family protein [Psychrobacter cibarius]|uniref:glycosyltransferase family protein n=1 Tax=Psychrobacter cibarius TaxID=282669 RepID=UPI001917F7ED|nr:glycosyltransferase [Psychrobacter cibarius]